MANVSHIPLGLPINQISPPIDYTSASWNGVGQIYNAANVLVSHTYFNTNTIVGLDDSEGHDEQAIANLANSLWSRLINTTTPFA